MRAKDAWLFHTCNKELPLVAGHLFDEDADVYSPPDTYDYGGDMQVDATPYYFNQVEEVLGKAELRLTEGEYGRLIGQLRAHLEERPRYAHPLTSVI